MTAPGNTPDYWIKRHESPSPHFVCSQAMFDYLKNSRPNITDDLLTGHLPAWFGTPVYIGACPTRWGCPTHDGADA